NYLWDFHPVDPPDSTLIIPLSRIYADTTRLTPINGYDWYQIYSSLQDADFGIFGTISTTIETPEPSGSAEIDTICIRNMRAMRNVAMRAGWGLRGQVRDSLNNRPLSARIEFVNPLRWSCYTDPDSGDFHKMLASGTYTIKVCANGYRSKIVSNIVVPPDSSIWLNVLLSPDQTYRYPFKFAWTVYADSFERIVPRSFYALGDSDGFYHSLGKSGDIALDMGLTPLINGPGVDFRVIEGNDGTAEGYRVYASNGWNGPWTLCGADTGSGDFSLPGSLPSARYIRITDDGDGQANSPTAGFDLDALKPLHFSSVEEQIITRLESSEPCLSVYPNPFRFKTEIKFSVGSRTKDRVLNIYDATGRLARSFCFISSGHCPATSLNWDGTDEKGRQLPGGVYFVEFKTENGRISEKLIRLR
ncbi:MAG: T9SS type A sorting domain-containing protein, partial [candidate division WOR-3 bacterium]